MSDKKDGFSGQKIDEHRCASSFLDLVKVVARLRNPDGGCPWDLEQTHETLKQYLIEESYEVIEAIDCFPGNDPDRGKLAEELGDVLLQVVLHSQIASEAGTFDIGTVADKVAKKMVARHPHVFGDQVAKTSQEVLQNWETRKKSELPEGKSILDGVPRGMPALLRAQRVGEKAARVGFEWRKNEEVRDKVLEEVREFLEQALSPDLDRANLEEEFGDILFALTQLSRRMSCNSEELLQRATDKFIRRFKKIEQRAAPRMQDYTLEQLDALWEEVKKEEKA